MLRPHATSPGATNYLPLVCFLFSTAAGGIGLGLVLVAVWETLRLLGVSQVGVAATLGLTSIAALLWPGLAALLPERACQVWRSDLFRYPVCLAACRWGVQLGVGFRTFIVTPAVYTMAAAALIQQGILQTAGICLVYGVARSGTIGWVAVIGRRAPGDRLPSGSIKKALRYPCVGLGTLTIAAAVLSYAGRT